MASLAISAASASAAAVVTPFAQNADGTATITTVQVGDGYRAAISATGLTNMAGNLGLQIFEDDNTCIGPFITNTFPNTSSTGSAEFSQTGITAVQVGALYMLGTADAAAGGPYTSACTLVLSVTKREPDITASASASPTAGSSFHGIAALSNSFNPTSNITLKIYKPGVTPCDPVNEVSSGNVDVFANGSFNGPDYTPPTPGTYTLDANFEGDSLNNQALSACTSVEVAAAPGSPSPLPTPAARTGRRAAALKKCKKKKGRVAKRKCRKKARKLPV